MFLKKNSKNLNKLFKKKLSLPKIDTQSLDIFSKAKNKINSYYIKLEWIAPTRHDDTFNIT